VRDHRQEGDLACVFGVGVRFLFARSHGLQHQLLVDVAQRVHARVQIAVDGLDCR